MGLACEAPPRSWVCKPVGTMGVRIEDEAPRSHELPGGRYVPTQAAPLSVDPLQGCRPENQIRLQSVCFVLFSFVSF